MTSKNPFGKSVSIEKFLVGDQQPYAVYQASSYDLGVITIAVLKTYKKPDNCKKDQHSRWFTAAKSDATYGSWDYGDQYADAIMNKFTLIECTPEWKAAYHAAG